MVSMRFARSFIFPAVAVTALTLTLASGKTLPFLEGREKISANSQVTTFLKTDSTRLLTTRCLVTRSSLIRASNSRFLTDLTFASGDVTILVGLVLGAVVVQEQTDIDGSPVITPMLPDPYFLSATLENAKYVQFANGVQRTLQPESQIVPNLTFESKQEAARFTGPAAIG